MRGIKPEYKFDIWIPELSPPEDLLSKYVINKEISWEEFKPLFKKRVLAKQKRLLRLVKHLSYFSNVTLLCWEESEDKCHRSLVLEALEKIKI